MLIKDFDNFHPYFTANESWGDISKIQWWHILQLYEIRNTMVKLGLKWPMKIHCCYDPSGHESNSLHYKGLATDFHFITEATLQEQYRLLCGALSIAKLDAFCGLGVYPEWNSPGFHFDSRGFMIRWIKLGDEYRYGMDKVVSFFSSPIRLREVVGE